MDSPHGQQSRGGAPRIAVLGAGLTGLSAALHLEKLGADPLVLEASDRPGGLCRTDWHDGFGFDHSIHILYTRDADAASMIRDALGDNLVELARRSFCYSSGVYTEYPYQNHNFGLPPEVIEENLLGLLAARNKEPCNPDNFQDWILATFGAGIARNFMLPYNRKVWAWDLRQMHAGWIADRVPTPTVAEVLRGALRPSAGRVGPNSVFWYPRAGGIESLPRALAARLRRPVLCQSRVSGLQSPEPGVAWHHQRDRFERRFDAIVSTLPVTKLVAMLPDCPPEVTRAAGQLSHNVVHTVCLGFNSLISPDAHWIYYPDEDLVFHRLSFPDQFCSDLTPPGCGSILAEVSESLTRPIDRDTLIHRTLTDLHRIGLISEHAAPAVARVKTLDPAYVIYTHAHRSAMDTIQSYLRSRRIFSVGRFGSWEYWNMDQSLLAGRSAAQAALDCLESRAIPARTQV